MAHVTRSPGAHPAAVAKPEGGLPGRRRRRRPSHWPINLMYLPAVLIMSAFIFYPFIQGIHISFTNWDGYSEQYKMVGLEQYRRLLNDPVVLRTIGNTFIYGCGSTLLQNALGLAYAPFLDHKIPRQGTLRTPLYRPII